MLAIGCLEQNNERVVAHIHAWRECGRSFVEKSIS